MAGTYIEAVRQALLGVLELVVRLGLPLAILAGLIVAGWLAAAALNPEVRRWGSTEAKRWATRTLAYAGVGFIFLAAWAALRQTPVIVRQEQRWKESAEATANPAPDAPPVYQFGPVAAALGERTYTRTLVLPPQFLQRIGADGIGVLAPYLGDPSAENVVKLADTFRRSGQNVVFTREVTLLEEQPIPFTRSEVKVEFKRLAGRAYDVEFLGRYSFANAGEQPINARFVFAPPAYGTVRDLSVSVSGQPVAEPTERGEYEWTSTIAPGESRQAEVRYRMAGARSWHYDVGSRRRRVQHFKLDALAEGPVKFMRGSVQPTGRSGRTLRWELANVVTNQQVALAFPPNGAATESFLQSLAFLPASLALFLVAGVLVGYRLGSVYPARLALALAAFALGLGASAVLANYIGPVAAVLLGPLLGAALAAWVLGPWSLAASLPAALLPAAFLSPEHSGLIVLGLIIAAMAVSAFVLRTSRMTNGTISTSEGG